MFFSIFQNSDNPVPNPLSLEERTAPYTVIATLTRQASMYHFEGPYC